MSVGSPGRVASRKLASQQRRRCGLRDLELFSGCGIGDELGHPGLANVAAADRHLLIADWPCRIAADVTDLGEELGVGAGGDATDPGPGG